MHPPGSKIYKIKSITIGSDDVARAIVAVGIVPSTGGAQYHHHAVTLPCAGKELTALRALLEARLIAAAPACIDSAVAE